MTQATNKNSIVVLPYTEIARLFGASKVVKQEAFIGESGVVYYQHQAKVMTEIEASVIAFDSANEAAFVRKIN